MFTAFCITCESRMHNKDAYVMTSCWWSHAMTQLCDLRFQVLLFLMYLIVHDVACLMVGLGIKLVQKSPRLAQIPLMLYTKSWLNYHTWYGDIHVWLAGVPLWYINYGWFEYRIDALKVWFEFRDRTMYILWFHEWT